MSDTPAAAIAGWTHGTLPANVHLGTHTLITADYAFKRFRTKEPDALLPEIHSQIIDERCDPANEFPFILKQEQLPLTVIEQGVSFRFELAALLIS